MTFRLTYSDGQETEYDDDTAWEVDDGVLKMGRKEGDWSVLVSPSHWAVIEVGGADSHKDDDKNEDKDKDEHEDEQDDDHQDDGGSAEKDEASTDD